MRIGGGARYPRGQAFDQLQRLEEALAAFVVVTQKKGWEANAKKAEEWYNRVKVGVQWCTDEWHKGQGGVKEARRLKRENGR